MNPDLKGKWALVTGASSGIGEAFAGALARQGANLVLVARRENVLEKLAETYRKQYGVRVQVIPCDLSRPEAPEYVFKRVHGEPRPLRLLVNNAGIHTFGRFDRTSLAENQKLVLLNAYALMTLTGFFLPEMLEAGEGAVINLSSLAAFRSMAYLSSYAASKAFVVSFSEALWAELRTTGVKVLAVCPGAVDTPMNGSPRGPRIKMQTPQQVVEMSFRALDRGQCCVIPGGFQNFSMANLGRLLPRRFSARIWERALRPRVVKRERESF